LEEGNNISQFELNYLIWFLTEFVVFFSEFKDFEHILKLQSELRVKSTLNTHTHAR
jgi:hypothetical protein